MLCPGKLLLAPALKNRELPHESRLLFGEQVANESNQFLANRRPQQQRARQLFRHFQVHARHSGKIAEPGRLKVSQFRLAWTYPRSLYLHHAPGAKIFWHSVLS